MNSSAWKGVSSCSQRERNLSQWFRTGLRLLANRNLISRPAQNHQSPQLGVYGIPLVRNFRPIFLLSFFWTSEGIGVTQVPPNSTQFIMIEFHGFCGIPRYSMSRISNFSASLEWYMNKYLKVYCYEIFLAPFFHKRTSLAPIDTLRQFFKKYNCVEYSLIYSYP
jgi:hypothetical protein